MDRRVVIRVAAIVAAGLVAAAALVRSRSASAVTVDATCETSPPSTTVTGSALDTFTPSRTGVVWTASSATLQLAKTAGVFGGSLLGVTNKILSGCSGDFDGDGWVDFVGIGTGADGKLIFYKNQTKDMPEPTDWYNPSLIRTPKFVAGPAIYTDTTIGTVVTGCADFNGDGKMDIALVTCNTTACTPPGKELIFLGKGDGTFQSPYTFMKNLSSLVTVAWSSNAMSFVDYNKDGKVDIVWGAADAPGATGGKVLVALNDGTTSPKFDSQAPVVLLPNMGFGAKGPDALAIADFTGDNVPDLMVGGVGTASLRLYPGLLGGGFSTSYQNVAGGFGGGATAILTGDFSLSGKNDIIVGTDGWNGYTGCKITYDKNGATTTPFAAGASWSVKCSSTDLDMGWVFDYDHDPDHTPDFVMADGNDSGTYYLFANRVTSKYVACGSVDSNPIDIGALASTEMTVTDVRLGPSVSLPSGTSVTWQASNDGGTSWHNTTACADDASKLCATFGSTVGSQIRWRATMCSNAAQSLTPSISGVSTSYTYVTATNHYRAGPIARDGVIYVGAFREPGDAGKVFAIDDASGAELWDAAAILDATTDSQRHIYTMAADRSRLEITPETAANGDLQQTMLTPDTDTAVALVHWFTSPRFGLVAPLHVLGGVENSTGALLSPPTLPYWYSNLATTVGERGEVNAFLAAAAQRPQLLLVGSKDGALHAFRSNPADPRDPTNGTEAWAFVPYDVAQRLLGDMTNGTHTAYPDGSPTLANVKIDGAWKSIVVSGEANGGRSIYALDVTETIDASGNILGPTPLWQFSDASMGRTYSKPTVIRTRVQSAEKWLVVFASGPGPIAGMGGTVYALDAGTGALVWRFDVGDSAAYVATDVTAIETQSEPGTYIDGYIDRVFFADSKGRIWKLDPADYDAEAKTIESIGAVTVSGLSHRALFSTRSTAGALGDDRAIAGTIAAGPDATNRLVLFFGTGGTDDTPSDAQNAFYAVYADSGEIRSKLDASSGIAVGTKFYGGVVYESGQLVFSDGQDLSGLGLCAPSAGNVVAIDANTFALEFVIHTSSKIVAPLFAQSGELYTVTLTGSLLATGFSSASSGGAGGAGGAASPAPPTSDGAGAGTSGAAADPFTVIGWKQVY